MHCVYTVLLYMGMLYKDSIYTRSKIIICKSAILKEKIKNREIL